MKSKVIGRDTASFVDDVLPAILNDDAFWPSEPRSLAESGVSEVLLESLICQQLLISGTLSGRNLSDRIGLSFALIDQQLSGMRIRQLITHARPAPLNDYYYSLTEQGQKRAYAYQKTCAYAGPAPVTLMDYLLSVEAQASHFEPITERKLVAALAGVTYDPNWLTFLGPAINSTSGIFLYGAPGNGKTTLAKCLTACRGSEIWIPHAIIDDGNIIKLYDASYHLPAGSISHSSKIMATREHDRRWIRIKRPTVVVGGELTLENLEVRHDPRSNTSEAPLQLKSNCGCLLIDDFGRQRVAPADLLNRWIIPLESRVDYLTLATGKKICVPFEQTILFSTNLQPESLVDEAFMRRVPFKIEIGDPSRAEFVELFRRACDASNIEWRPETIERFIDVHYCNGRRPFRRCHPRDLLAQVKALSAYREQVPEIRMDYLDMAWNNYFGSDAVNLVGDKSKPAQNQSFNSADVPAGFRTSNASPANSPVQNKPLPAQGPMTNVTARVPIRPIPNSSNPSMTQKLVPGTFPAQPATPQTGPKSVPRPLVPNPLASNQLPNLPPVADMNMLGDGGMLNQ